MDSTGRPNPTIRKTDLMLRPATRLGRTGRMNSLRKSLLTGQWPRLDILASLLIVVVVFAGKLGIDRLVPAIDHSPLFEFRFWSILGALAIMWHGRATVAWARAREPALLALTALCAMLWVRGLFGHGPGFAEKSLDMVYLLAQCMVVLVSTRRQLVLMAAWAILFAMLLFLLAAYGVGDPQLNGEGWAPIGGPTTFYRIEFLGVCLCWCFYRVLGPRYWVLPIAAIALLFGTLASLSKIALPGATLVLTVFTLNHLRRKDWRSAALVVAASVAPILIWQSTKAETMQRRMDRALIAHAPGTITAAPGKPRVGTDFEIQTNYCIGHAPGETTAGDGPANCITGYFVDRSSRLVFAAHALAGIAAKPLFGQGVAAFALHMPNPQTSKTEVYRYPHNIVLEIAFEAGLIGAGLLLLALGALFWLSIRAAWAEPVGLYLLGYMVFMLLSALVSGDFYDSRLLWVAGFALIGLARPRAPAQ